MKKTKIIIPLVVLLVIGGAIFGMIRQKRWAERKKDMLPVEDFVIYVVDIPKSQLPKGTPPGYVQEDGDHPGITWASKNAVDWYEEQVKLPWKRVEEQKLKTRFNYHQVDFVIQNRNWTLYVPHQPGIVLDKKGWERE